MEGGAVNITCCWTRQFGRVGVQWLNHITVTSIIQTEIFIWTNPSQGSLQKETSNCSHLIFTNVTREDSGRYICKVSVEIPLLIVVSGKGTFITVRDKTSTKDNAAEGVSSDTLVVTQTPDVSVMEGGAVNITCCWTRQFGRVGVQWLNHITVTSIIQTNSSQGSLQKETSNCSHLIFTNVTREDSGRYICKVSLEIPLLIVVSGNGTVITVSDKTSTKDSAAEGGLPLPVLISLAVVAPLLLITLACFCTLRRIQGSQAARVIYEVPHIDSEEVEMDKHSTGSSRGSSQWCQVPVYESFDYFERVQTKESG
ncbi:carcinoembryonic antigen-related cell adhesion molecule 1 isoform X2 [Perca fluviatilis]|nr:carcinoembryonic antigen-related cell adhesion molecule 1 isoform X2 [Perca fluviatilis]